MTSARMLAVGLVLFGRPLEAGAELIVEAAADSVAVDRDHGQATVAVTIRSEGPAPAQVRLTGRGLERVRIRDGARVLELPEAVPGRRLPLVLTVAGREPSAAGGDVTISAEPEPSSGPRAQVTLTVVELRWLGARNEPIDPARGALQVSNAVTDDDGLPRDRDFGTSARDPDAFRLEVLDPRPGTATVEIESLVPGRPGVRDRVAAVEVRHGGPRAPTTARTPFLRLVTDDLDRTIPELQGQLLRVALGDTVQVRWRGARASIAVGRPAGETGPQAVLHARFDVMVLRSSPGGPPVVGRDDVEAIAIGRRQVEIANEVYAQCNVQWGDPQRTRVRLVDPPQATLLAIADGTGLHAAGGVVRLRVGGRPIRALETRAGWRPRETAAALAERIRALGFVAMVSENVRNDFAAGPSADVMARGPRGETLRFEADGAAPLTTDPRQRLAIGSVDLGDLLDDFDNMTAAAGTLEERTLIKTLTDGDPETIDMFVVSRFASGGRQGEAFVEGDGGSIVNGVLLDRSGIRQERESWTQSHEAGHVLLDQAFHPDNTGIDRPWLLMDSDASLGSVSGPKRLGEDECARMRLESGPDAMPTLLHRQEWP